MKKKKILQFNGVLLKCVKLNLSKGCKIKAYCPLLKYGPVDEVPSVGVFLSACIYTSSGENHGKLRTARSTSVTGD